MTKAQAERRSGELNAMAKRDEYHAKRTDAGDWFVGRTFVATLMGTHTSRDYIGIEVAT